MTMTLKERRMAYEMRAEQESLMRGLFWGTVLGAAMWTVLICATAWWMTR